MNTGWWIASFVFGCVACGAGGGAAPPNGPPPPAETAPPMSTAPAPAPTSGGESETGDAPAPSSGGSTGATTSCAGPPPGPDYECVKNCGPPVARAGDPDPGSSWLSKDQAQKRKQFGCPICLPSDARIATATGEVAIDRLAEGDRVWSLSADGKKVLRRVEHVVSVPAPPRHRIAVIELEDGRRMRASPGHPDSAGQAVGVLHVGDLLDGSRVRSVKRVPYAGRTYDLVLEGGAAVYFADGVRLRSSLKTP